ncbi:sulfite exporter TauE/SafE family protein [Tropicibacter naphthalenivorans]|uniref:Probable membrane transporter protein n=1 Tax=Tropicibacter naphthalenivorans TaxID=441103 RepID=A0A0P1G6E9_9RHOB|nr:sulfite exporter TauE/SafE family protein [Tropicibacter naphthalenivorans]CUH77310.1 Sulfite exporter TauE/SafE [Tropicibacter naphthalenivorans]SMC59096.1 hypothetical protein SAMN04488093_102211 [Tropicibacter naphthalenivorans]
MEVLVDGAWVGLVWVSLALVLGGILKGATGAGAPVIAVPVIAIYYDVPTAVAVMVLPNFATNLIQSWKFRAHLPAGAMAWAFAGGGFVGALLGTVMLAHVAPRLLLMMVAAVVLAYIGFRLLRPDWGLGMALGRKLALPAGVVAGILQGATGVSAPVSITFLNAMRLERAVFVAVISLFFLSMTVVQIPSMAWYGLLTVERGIGSAAALVPLVGAMPLGAWLARRIAPQTFDRVILALLGGIAVKLLWDALL